MSEGAEITFQIGHQGWQDLRGLRDDVEADTSETFRYKHLPNLGYQEWDTEHGKLSAQLDLRDQLDRRDHDDVDTLRGLVREADVFSQG